MLIVISMQHLNHQQYKSSITMRVNDDYLSLHQQWFFQINVMYFFHPQRQTSFGRSVNFLIFSDNLSACPNTPHLIDHSIRFQPLIPSLAILELFFPNARDDENPVFLANVEHLLDVVVTQITMRNALHFFATHLAFLTVFLVFLGKHCVLL